MTPDGIDDSIAHAAPTTMVKAAASMLGLSGIVTLVLGLQMALGLRFVGLLAMVPYAMLAVGLVAMAIGWMVFRARAWAAFVSVGLAAGVGLSLFIWLIFTITHGIISPLALLAVAFWAVTLPLTLLAIAPCKRAAAARRLLESQGLDFGI